MSRKEQNKRSNSNFGADSSSKNASESTKHESRQKDKYRRTSSRNSTSSNTSYGGSMCNDPSWYIPTDQNINDVASFSYSMPVGATLPMGKEFSGISSSAAVKRAAGVMVFDMIPTVGLSVDQYSPLNAAANNIYNEIRRANSGTKVYDAPDCMQLMIAIASIYSAVSWAQRVYGVANVYSTNNLYMPRAIIEGMGVDFDDVLNHMSDFRAALNQIVLSVNTYNVPKNIPLFKRWWSVYENIYTDSNTTKFQMYMANPAGFFVYDDKSTDLAVWDLTKLTGVTPGTKIKTSNIISMLQLMLSKLTYSEDARTISADIEKAFGGGGLYSVPMIPENYTVPPTRSDELRTQFMNAVNVDAKAWTYKIQQDATRGFLTSTFSCISNSYVPYTGKWLNFHSDGVTPADAMVASRLIPSFNKAPVVRSEGKEFVHSFSSLPSEVVSNIRIVSLLDNGLSSIDTKLPSTINLNVGETLDTFTALTMWSQFDWAPAITVVAATADSFFTGNYLGFMMDIDTGTYISPEDIAKLNTMALFGLLGIPNIRG